MFYHDEHGTYDKSIDVISACFSQYNTCITSANVS